MPKKKITPSLEKLVLKVKYKFPYLGVRDLADLLAKKHKVKISKSAIHNILKQKGLKQKPGRKRALSLYKTEVMPNCGLILISSIDYQIGLFEHIANELKPYFARINKELLKKLVILTAFSSFIGEELPKSIKRKGFLKLVGLNRLPLNKIKLFNKRLIQYKPILSLKSVKENVRIVSTIKFYFNNGDCGFCDAKMSSFWDGPCKFDEFFLPLRAAKAQIEKMLAEKEIFVGYTKSFDYLSPLAFNFIKGIESGVEKIDFLDEAGRRLDQLGVALGRIHLFFGYYPEIVSKGIEFLTHPKRFRRFSWSELGEFFCSPVLMKFAHPKEKQALSLHNILIKERTSSLPEWGLLTTLDITNKKADLGILLKKYLYLWPYVMKDFFKDIEDIEKALLAPSESKDYLKDMLPRALSFSSALDFVRLGQILAVMFKEIIGGWEPKGKSGSFTLHKDYIRVLLSKAPRDLKKKANKAGLYIDKRRVFIV